MMAFRISALPVTRKIVTRKIHAVGPDGQPITIHYPMIRLPGDTSRIGGCHLEAPQGHQA